VFPGLNELLAVLQQNQAGELSVSEAADRLMPLVRAHGGAVSPATAAGLLAKVQDPRIHALLAEVERRREEDGADPPT
jgi:hypothetical protein